jgi:hypothetical protein
MEVGKEKGKKERRKERKKERKKERRKERKKERKKVQGRGHLTGRLGYRQRCPRLLIPLPAAIIATGPKATRERKRGESCRLLYNSVTDHSINRACLRVNTASLLGLFRNPACGCAFVRVSGAAPRPDPRRVPKLRGAAPTTSQACYQHFQHNGLAPYILSPRVREYASTRVRARFRTPIILLPRVSASACR